jgi:hypothetical protein
MYIFFRIRGENFKMGKYMIVPKDELMHYGVLGMKWGVRRYQPYSKGKHGKFLGQDRDEDIVIKRGTGAYRLQSREKLEGNGQTYVSFSKLDHLKYISVTSGGDGGVMLDGASPEASHGYSVKLKVSNDLIVPSYQKSMDAFVDAVSKVGIKEVAKQVERYDYKSKNFIKDMKRLSIDEARDRAYVNFMGTMMRDSAAKREFFNNLKKQGYNAIVDEWDHRFGTERGFTDTPVIVFEKNRNLKQTSSRKLDQRDADYATAPEYFNSSTGPLAAEIRKRWDNY